MEHDTNGPGGRPPRDCVVVEGINARGFGTVPKAVMRDAGLPVEAKGIYAYLCSFAGGGQAAFPSRATMLAELGMSKDRFYKYRQMLLDRRLLRIEHRSEGNVAHPVRTNVYILTSEMPACYREAAAKPSPSPSGAAARDGAAAASPQVGNDVPETRTPFGGFPQSAGQQRRPENQDVLETRTTNRPENQDTGKARFPSSRIENGGGIKNSLRRVINPPVQPGDSLTGMERDFAELASPERTPNRNRIRDALSSYGEVRTRFPASVIASAWERRQRGAREAGRPARFYPQLARWLEDPGPEGAARMCEDEKGRRTARMATRLAVALSLDEGYMAMREEAAALARQAPAGPSEGTDAERLAALEAAMAAIREAKAAEVAAAAGGEAG